MKKQFSQVFPDGKNFTFRCQLPSGPFRCEEPFEHEIDAAFAHDCFFLVLLRKYPQIPPNLLKPSMPREDFVRKLLEVGVLDSKSLGSGLPCSVGDLLLCLPSSCRDFLADEGGVSIVESLEAKKNAGAKGFEGL